MAAKYRSLGHAIGKGSSTYSSWKHMHERCRSSACKDFPNYGGRGIEVCERWKSFENFLADMGERPAGKTLDRYPNSDGNYEPGNCRWATRSEQNTNRFRSRPPKLDDQQQNQIRWLLEGGHRVSEVARVYGVSRALVRLVREGKSWSSGR